MEIFTSQFWLSTPKSSGLHLNAGWFWLFPLLFLMHDAEEATFVWIKGSLHNSISYITLDFPETLVAISFELTLFMLSAAFATVPDASNLAIFTFAIFLGGYTAHGFVHLYMGWRAHKYTLGVVTALPLVVFGGLFIYTNLIEAGTISWIMAIVSFTLGVPLMFGMITVARWVGLNFAGCKPTEINSIDKV